MRSRLVAKLAILMWSAVATAEAQESVPLYAEEIPNSIASTDQESLRDPREPWPFYQNISRPQIYTFPLAGDARPAIVILPGGGYRGVSIVKEGFDIAKQLNAYGIAAFVVKYRTPSDAHMHDKSIAPLQDAQQALRLVRARAKEWNVDVTRVGLLGFSAGGHLAATAATHFHQPLIAGSTSAQVRPDFLMLGYPVISFDGAIAHSGSREMLLGKQPPREQIERFSNERHVTAETPQTFIFHAADDTSVVVANSLRFFEALQAKRVPAELIVYPAGGHGFGLNNPTTPDRWIERCRDWLLSRGILRTSAPGEPDE